jgi:hypothetical protein
MGFQTYEKKMNFHKKKKEKIQFMDCFIYNVT